MKTSETLPMDALQIELQSAGYTCTEAKQYIDNCCKQHYDKHVSRLLAHCAASVRDNAAVAIAHAFVWQYSPQGHDYWAKIEQRLLSHNRQ